MSINEEKKGQAPQEYFLPAVDALETPDELVLIADMPGVAPGGLEVTVDEGVLTLRGRVGASTAETARVLQREFERGDYFRQLRIPRDFLTDKIDATLKAGVVTVRIPRAERSRPRHIPVRVE